MSQDTPEILAKAAGTQIAAISQDSIAEWCSELRVLKNIPVHGSAIAGLLLESVIFGQYYVGEKLKSNLDADEQNRFDKEIRERIIFMLSFILHSENEQTDRETHGNKITEMYDSFAASKLLAYSHYKGNTILDLYKAYLRDLFNQTDIFDVKFFESTLWNRLKLNIGGAMSGSDSKFKDSVFLDQSILFFLADSIFNQFSALNYRDLLEVGETL